MLIGKLVKEHIIKIFEYCENQDRDELFNLMNDEYSKRMFASLSIAKNPWFSSSRMIIGSLSNSMILG